jgi:transketolase
MLNPLQKFNSKLFNADVELVSTRTGFGEGLVLAGEADPNVVGLCADLTESIQMHFFKGKFPERFVQVGVAEQNLVGIASGLAAMGKVPFIGSYAIFSPGRNWEQIRTLLCYNCMNVKIIGSHAGVSVGPDGGSHQALEDIAIIRVIPRMTVISPCDAIEAKKATMAAAKIKGPVYIRLAREKTPVITAEESPFEIGKAQIVWQSGEVKKAGGTGDEKTRMQSYVGMSQVGIIATGPLLYRALIAARELESENITVTVMNLATIKPLDSTAVIELAKNTGAIVTVEEHQIAGGMGSAVAECLSQGNPVPMEFIGVSGQFGQSGTPAELIQHYGMGVSHIKAAAKKVLARKTQVNPLETLK